MISSFSPLFLKNFWVTIFFAFYCRNEDYLGRGRMHDCFSGRCGLCSPRLLQEPQIKGILPAKSTFWHGVLKQTVDGKLTPSDADAATSRAAWGTWGMVSWRKVRFEKFQWLTVLYIWHNIKERYEQHFLMWILASYGQKTIINA